jgi:hypothetical protein
MRNILVFLGRKFPNGDMNQSVEIKDGFDALQELKNNEKLKEDGTINNASSEKTKSKES